MSREKFRELIQNYNIALKLTYGYGVTGQDYVHDEYKKMEQFCEINSEYKDFLPIKHKYFDAAVRCVSDDNCGYTIDFLDII